MNTHDDTIRPLTGMPRSIQRKEEELAQIPERVRYHLDTGQDALRVEEWATEKRARLHTEIAALHATIAARQQKANGRPAPAQEHQGTASTLIPLVAPVAPQQPMRDEGVELMEAAQRRSDARKKAAAHRLPTRNEEKRRQDLEVIRRACHR